jgi:hypothetical protein
MNYIEMDGNILQLRPRNFPHTYQHILIIMNLLGYLDLSFLRYEEVTKKIVKNILKAIVQRILRGVNNKLK